MKINKSLTQEELGFDLKKLIGIERVDVFEDHIEINFDIGD